jgi:hypothetical protein
LNKIKSIFELFAGAQTLIILVLSMLSLGCLKAFLGMRKVGVSRFGMGGVMGKKKRHNAAGQIVVVEYNKEGDGIDPVT